MIDRIETPASRRVPQFLKFSAMSLSQQPFRCLVRYVCARLAVVYKGIMTQLVRYDSRKHADFAPPATSYRSAFA